jgi:predicted GNAT family N-acyltransferase
MDLDASMVNDSIQIEVVSWNLQRETLRTIRGKVFIEEQNVPREIEWDDHDDTATHFLLTSNTVALGCGRMLPDGKIGRMAVLPEHRGMGLGRQLLDYIVEYALRNGISRLYLHAQTHALDFYLAAGFQSFGEEFHEAGIPHAAMELLIDYRGAEGFITGVRYPEPFGTLALELAKSARRSLRIYSAELDREVFDNREMAAAITSLARRGRHSDVRILINNAKPMVKQGHQLLSLARRLSSTITIRVLDEHPDLPDASFVLRDSDGTVYKPDERGRPGFYEPDSRASAKRLIDQFDALWRWGEVDPRLRLLRL